MMMRDTCLNLAAACAALTVAAGAASAQVVINEFTFERIGSDDYEFIELYNAGESAVDISGWSLASRDTFNTSPSNGCDGTNTALINNTAIYVVNQDVVLQPGDFYVLGSSTTPNVDQDLGPQPLFNGENRNETIELHNATVSLLDPGTTTLVDAVLVEANKNDDSTPPCTLPFEILLQIGNGLVEDGNSGFGYYPNVQSESPIAGGQAISLSRIDDGDDSNRNAFDFKTRPETPGESNTAGFNIVTELALVDPDSLSPGDTVPGFNAGSYSSPTVIDPTVALGDATLNPTAIPAPPGGLFAIATADAIFGGGNTAVSDDIFLNPAETGQAVEYSITAYIEVTVTPGGSGQHDSVIYGLGTPAMIGNDFDPAGLLLGEQGFGESYTGIGWVLQRDEDNVRLVLAEAALGGPADALNTGTREAPIPRTNSTVIRHAILDLLTLELSSGWYELTLQVNPDESFFATFSGVEDPAIGTLTYPVDGSFFVRYNECCGGAPVTAEDRPAAFVPNVIIVDCAVDLNGDGIVDFFDFALYQNLAAEGDPAAEFDDMAGIGFGDVLTYESDFEDGCD